MAADMESKVHEFAVKGLCAAPFTAMRADRSVNLDAIAGHIATLVEDGVHFAFVCGTTGESYRLTKEERKAIMERWVKEAAGTPLQVIAHTGCESLEDTLELTKHAASIGVAAIGVMPPVFMKLGSIANMVEWLKTISASAPAVPLYYYHIPCMTNVNIKVEQLVEGVHGVVPTFRGVKFSDYDLYDFANCVDKFDGKYDMLFGRDEILLAALAVGCTGAVGSTYNYSGKLYNRMINAFRAGDMATARKLGSTVRAGVDLLGGTYSDGANVGKTLAELRGIDVGPPRFPQKPMTAEAKAKLAADAKSLGILE